MNSDQKGRSASYGIDVHDTESKMDNAASETVDLSVQDRLLLVTTMTMMLSTEIHNP